MSPPDNTFALPTEVFSSCLAIVSAVTVDGFFCGRPCDMELVTGRSERPGHKQTPSDVHWRRFYFQLTCVHSTFELSGRCTLQIYLLTYQLNHNAQKCKVRKNRNYRSSVNVIERRQVVDPYTQIDCRDWSRSWSIGSQPGGHINHKPGSRLLLLFTRPVDTSFRFLWFLIYSVCYYCITFAFVICFQ